MDGVNINKMDNSQIIYPLIKRIIDILASLIGLIFLIIPFMIIGLIIKLDSPGPIFFKQKRFGKNDRVFTIYKFRTMHLVAPSDLPTHRLENAASYITKVGSFLRATSIDELPQLINVLINDMSLIGPRPCVLSYYEVIKLRRLNGSNKIKPGLSGLAQTEGRDLVSNEDKAKMDGEYYNNMSLKLDFKILLKTLVIVFKRTGFKEGTPYL